MSKNKETVLKIQKAAMKEFLEKGFMKASLRKICHDAGVTTGALYFFFKDKDDLFCSLVREPVEKIYKIMTEHYALETDISEENVLAVLKNPEGSLEDQKAMLSITKIMYENRDKIMLLVGKAQGSSMENIVDKFVEISAKQYEKMVEKMKLALPDIKISKHYARWVAKQQIEAVIYSMINIKDEKETELFGLNVAASLRGGWMATWKLQ